MTAGCGRTGREPATAFRARDVIPDDAKRSRRNPHVSRSLSHHARGRCSCWPVGNRGAARGRRHRRALSGARYHPNVCAMSAGDRELLVMEFVERDVPGAPRTRSVAATRRDGPRTGDRQRPHGLHRHTQLIQPFQPARQRVPTRENAAHQLSAFVESIAYELKKRGILAVGRTWASSDVVVPATLRLRIQQEFRTTSLMQCGVVLEGAE